MRGDAGVIAAAALLAEPARAALVLAVIDDGPLPASEPGHVPAERHRQRANT